MSVAVSPLDRRPGWTMLTTRCPATVKRSGSIPGCNGSPKSTMMDLRSGTSFSSRRS